MSEHPPSKVWEMLPPQRQRIILLTLGQMALRRLRGATAAQETADEGRRLGAAPRRGDAGEDPATG